MEKKDKTKTVAVILVLAIQLNEWITFAHSTGATTQRFKYLAGLLSNSLNNLLKFMFDGHDKERDDAYEHSVRISDLLGELIDMDDDQQRRVLGLIKKMKAGS